jgi:hypothetical protein
MAVGRYGDLSAARRPSATIDEWSARSKLMVKGQSKRFGRAQEGIVGAAGSKSLRRTSNG